MLSCIWTWCKQSPICSWTVQASGPVVEELLSIPGWVLPAAVQRSLVAAASDGTCRANISKMRHYGTKGFWSRRSCAAQAVWEAGIVLLKHLLVGAPHLSIRPVRFPPGPIRSELVLLWMCKAAAKAQTHLPACQEPNLSQPQSAAA